jgi:hypothetical protein
MSDAAASKEQSASGQILVLGGTPSQRAQLAEEATRSGHQVHTEQAAPAATGNGSWTWADLDAVLIVAEERDQGWAELIQQIRPESASPPLVVLGPASGTAWRGRALKAGAFLCASLEAPAEELESILSAVTRYRSLEKEINLLRVECERICLGLLKSYGHAAANLKNTTEEVEALQRSLRDIRNQIIRAFV